jgi:nucleoid DNA-binding protein
VTRRDLVKSLTRLGLTRTQATAAVDAFFAKILSALKEGRKISIVGFGTWEWRERVPRKARNPKTGKVVVLGPRKVVFFKPSRLLKEKLNTK